MTKGGSRQARASGRGRVTESEAAGWIRPQAERKGPVDAAFRALKGANGGCGLGPKFMAGRLFASSASPHRGPDSAVFSPKQRTPRLHTSICAAFAVSGPSRGRCAR